MDIGIDLGATCSVIAAKGNIGLAPGYTGSEYLPEIDVTILPSSTGNLTIPSVMWWHPDDPDRYMFGDEAKRMAGEGKSPIVFSKRSIGTKNALMLNGRAFAARDVAERFLRYMKEWAETVTAQTVGRAVIAHPAYFTLEQLEETMLAALGAGLDIKPEQMLLEPCAAALACTQNGEREAMRVMVYDLGGATFDVTVLEQRDGEVGVRSIHGDGFLGGDNFDNTLVHWVLDQLTAKGTTIPDDENNEEHEWRRSRMLQLAENVKIRLAEQGTDKASVPVPVDFLVDDTGQRVQFRGHINREQYAALIGDDLQKTIEWCRTALAKAEMAPEDLDAILLVGGSTYGQWVQECVASAFPQLRIVKPSHPDLCVAAGATIKAATLSRLASDSRNTPALSYASLTDLSELLVQASSRPASWDSVQQYEGTVNTRLFESRGERTVDTELSEHSGERTVDTLLSERSGEPPVRLGPFLVQRLLGHGAFSMVYLAIDVTSSIKRTVALKIPIWPRRLVAVVNGPDSAPGPARESDRDPRIERLRREALLWQSLSLIGHPNILQFEDLKHIDNDVFFVMEYMSGGNLEDALDGIAGERRIEAIVQSLEPICAGLAFAHGIGVVHGDIKPQNILVQGGQVKLADFGLSFTIGTDDGPVTGRTLGSMMFLPPESFDGVRTPSMDVYALGVTLYYLLASEYPFHRFVSDPKDLRTAKLTFRPSVRAKCPAVPAWLDEIIQRCMAPRPEDRFRDGQDLLDQVRFNHVVVAAHWNLDSKTAVYDMDVQGIRAKELLHHQIADGNIDGLCAAWDRLGVLALERAAAHPGDRAQFDGQIGKRLEHISTLGPRFVLDARMLAALSGARIASLWLRCDPRLTALPWELFKIGATYACLEFPVARWPMMIQSTPTPDRRMRGQTLRLLIVVDPSGDLSGAGDEYRDLMQEFDSSSRGQLRIEISDSSDTAFELRAKMVGCDIIHFIGHAFCVVDQEDLTRSGWLLKSGPDGDQILKATDLEELWNGFGPTLVFANSCQSARSSVNAVRTPLKSDAALGLASAFLSKGVANYIGAVWEVPDTAPATRGFAVSFYHELLAGASIGNALHSARVQCSKEFGIEELTWARYVHCGDPSARLFPPRS